MLPVRWSAPGSLFSNTGPAQADRWDPVPMSDVVTTIAIAAGTAIGVAVATNWTVGPRLEARKIEHGAAA